MSAIRKLTLCFQSQSLFLDNQFADVPPDLCMMFCELTKETNIIGSIYKLAAYYHRELKYSLFPLCTDKAKYININLPETCVNAHISHTQCQVINRR